MMMIMMMRMIMMVRMIMGPVSTYRPLKHAILGPVY